MILCIGTTPAAQRVMVFRKITMDAVNRAVTTLDGPAGKVTNVAKVLQVLNERPVAVTFLGGDRGEFIRRTLVELGVELDCVPVPARTRECVTMIDQAAGTITELVEEGRPVAAADFDTLLQRIRRRMAGCRAVVMSGTIAAGGPVDLYYQCVQMANASGILSVADAQGAALVEALQARPGLVKPNRPELAATVGRELPDEQATRAAMCELHERGARRVIITAGKEPALAFDGRNWWRVVAPNIEAVNPIGSGDAFTAGVVSRLVRGEDLGEACRWGAAAGAANALTLMAGEVRREDVERLVRAVQIERLS